MGVDLYMNWDDKTEEDKQAQITGYKDAGNAGCLRGAYFGGYSDVLRFLFDWMDWGQEVLFLPDAFEANLNKLKANNLERPSKGRWDYTKGAERGWDFSERQNQVVHEDAIEEYEAFLALGRQLVGEGKNPTIYISY